MHGELISMRITQGYELHTALHQRRDKSEIAGQAVELGCAAHERSPRRAPDAASIPSIFSIFGRAYAARFRRLTPLPLRKKGCLLPGDGWLQPPRHRTARDLRGRPPTPSLATNQYRSRHRAGSLICQLMSKPLTRHNPSPWRCRSDAYAKALRSNGRSELWLCQRQ
jgi:hypothetical protein